MINCGFRLVKLATLSFVFWSNNILHTVLRLRISGAIPPIPMCFHVVYMRQRCS